MFEQEELVLLQKAFERYHAARILALPGEDELHDVHISEKTERRMERLFYHQKHFYYVLINTAAKRVACILAAALLAATVTTASVEALREGFIRFVVETFEKGSTIWFSKEDEGTPIQPITPKTPAYLPSGYQLVTDMSNEFETNLIYEGNKTEYFQFLQLPKGSKRTVNTEGVDYTKILILNIYEGIIFQNLGDTYLIFNDNEYMYTIIGTVTEEEILKIAESIPLKEN